MALCTGMCMGRGRERERGDAWVCLYVYMRVVLPVHTGKCGGQRLLSNLIFETEPLL